MNEVHKPRPPATRPAWTLFAMPVALSLVPLGLVCQIAFTVWWPLVLALVLSTALVLAAGVAQHRAAQAAAAPHPGEGGPGAASDDLGEDHA